MTELFTTIMHRPYVFAFLAAYLVLAWRFLGARRMLLWLVSGYAIAWLSEWSSIHNGFPYGTYRYVYEGMPGELMIAGVPFFDSLSYPFLIFASYATAAVVRQSFSSVIGPTHARAEAQCGTICLGALFTMLLDMIVDPLATMGDKWFLGRIHEYAHPGWYFGVPMTNFGGWFLVAFAVIAFNVLCWRLFPQLFARTHDHAEVGPHDFWLPLFYVAIALFNLIITFSVGEWKLGLASAGILAAIAVAILTAHAKSRRSWIVKKLIA
jgi:uncharacterized membrane protein